MSLGILLGKIRIFGFALGESAVFFAALAFGHYGLTVPKDYQAFGIVLFIFTVGIQNGAGFFESFRQSGHKYASIVILQLAFVLSIALSLSNFFGIHLFSTVGIFTGALTSSTGLVAAVDATKSDLTSIAFGIGYPVATVATILTMEFLIRFMKINFKKSEDEFIEYRRRQYPEIINKNFQVLNPALIGKSIKDVEFRTMTGATITRIKINDEVFVPSHNTIFEEGCIVKAVGTVDSLSKVRLLLGEESAETLFFSRKDQIEWVLVTNRRVVGKTLGYFDFFNSSNAIVSRIKRSGIDMVPSKYIKLRFGDKVMIAGSKNGLNLVKNILGNSTQVMSETNFFPICLGIVVGVLIGLIKIPINNDVSVSLGSTGGVLITALILSRIGKTGPVIWALSGSGTVLLRRLGLMIFLSSIGSNAGTKIMNGVNEEGLLIALISAVSVFVPMVATTIYARKVLKLNPIIALGTVAGALTTLMGLSSLQKRTDTEIPMIAYTSTYPLGLILTIIISQLFKLLT